MTEGFVATGGGCGLEGLGLVTGGFISCLFAMPSQAGAGCCECTSPTGVGLTGGLGLT